MQNATTAEQLHHLRAMQELADDLKVDFHTVKAVYELELQALQHGAKLRDYLPLLTSRHVRVLLSGNR